MPEDSSATSPGKEGGFGLEGSFEGTSGAGPPCLSPSPEDEESSFRAVTYCS